MDAKIYRAGIIQPSCITKIFQSVSSSFFKVRCLPLSSSIRDTIGQNMLQARVEVYSSILERGYFSLLLQLLMF